jgi:hypothetical protein
MNINFKTQKRRNLDLQNDEHIIVKTKIISQINSKRMTLGLFSIFLLVGIVFLVYFLILVTNTYFFLSSFFYLPFSFIFLTAGILLLKVYLESKNTEYYLTSRRIVEFTQKGLLFRKQKIKEFNFSSISYLVYYINSLEIASTDIKGGFHYNGSEINLLDKKAKRDHRINIELNGENGKKIKEKITNYLIQTVPLIEHPNIEYLYINH